MNCKIMQKIKNSRVVIVVLNLIFTLQSNPEGLKTTRRFTFKLEKDYKEDVLQEIQRHNFTFLYKITPTTYILEYTGNSIHESTNIVQSLLQSSNGKIIAAEPVRIYKNELAPLISKSLRSLSPENTILITPRLSVFEYTGHLRDIQLDRLTRQIQARFKNQIISMEKVTVYENTIKPQELYEPAPTNSSVQEVLDVKRKRLEIDNHYGMAVSKAHALGYTGKGVVVAITDVGIHTDNLDLRENIDKGLSFNFINDSQKVTPEYFHDLQDTSVPVTAHGDHCSSIIASVRGNGICTFGISYNATIVGILEESSIEDIDGLKIFRVTLYKEKYFNLEYGHSTRSDVISRAFVHKLSEIDIFSNAWAPTKSFAPLDRSITDAIEYGATKGRDRLGTIYVVPAGPTGNELANNIYTIAVNGIGRHWAVPADSFVSASVITSGLSSGSNISSDYLVTTSQRNKCVTDFRGVSAATAQIAAIIALALEANRNITLRQLKNLLVHASDPEESMHDFSTNAAGHRFHTVFGFGLLNAERLVLLAKKTKPALPQLKKSFKEASMREIGSFAQETEFCYNCDVYNSANCLDTIEDVVIKMRITNKCEQFKMVLVSPSGTESVFIPFGRVAYIRRTSKLQFTSVHFWDEEPFGTWRLKLFYSTESCSDRIKIQHISLILYGTRTWNQETQIHRKICDGSRNIEHTTASVTTTLELLSPKSIFVHADLIKPVHFLIISITILILCVILLIIHCTNVLFPNKRQT